MDEKIVKDSQGLAKDLVNDCISRQEAIDAINGVLVEDDACKVWFRLALQNLPSAQPKSYREGYQAGFKDAQPECAKDFVMLKVIDLNGRPYYSIIYLENGNEFEGYSSYDLKVISEYLKRYFGFEQPEIIRCRECRYHYGSDCDKFAGVWVKDDDFCSRAERREVSK